MIGPSAMPSLIADFASRLAIDALQGRTIGSRGDLDILRPFIEEARRVVLRRHLRQLTLSYTRQYALSYMLSYFFELFLDSIVRGA